MAGECIVYLLTNPAMPGLVKIGHTTRDDMRGRLRELYGHTGVPLPFNCVYAKKVPNGEQVEKALHTAFSQFEGVRINKNREFFRIAPSQASVILQAIEGEEKTAEVEKLLDDNVSPSEKEAANKYARDIAKLQEDTETNGDEPETSGSKKRSSPINFELLGLVGKQLVFEDGITTVTVEDARNVRYNDEVMSLTMATRMILNAIGQIRPTGRWKCGNENLLDLYEKSKDTMQPAINGAPTASDS